MAQVPLMPIDLNPPPEVHRDHVPCYDVPFNLLVAEPVSRAQRKAIPKAQAACDKEWDKLLTVSYTHLPLPTILLV